MAIETILVKTKKELDQFIDLPHEIYREDPHYVPMMYMEQEALLNKKKSPFFEHSIADYFLAKKNGRLVGRIAAIKNNNHIKFTGKNEGFFGFFDTIHDYEVAAVLLDKASAWISHQGMNKMIGPANFSTNETVGSLIDNFEESPFIMNTYNFSYYNDFYEKYGLRKSIDLLCYELIPEEIEEKWIPFGRELEARLNARGYSFRKVNMKKFKAELDLFLPIYNQSWVANTGFVPMTAREVNQIAKDLKPIVDPDFIYFAEKDGKPVGVSITIPNLNEIQKNIKKGRLLPTGLFKILFGLKKIKTVRVLALGTLQEYRKLGIDVCFYVRNILTAKEKGIKRAEASWILENNAPMNNALLHIGGKVYRKYRIFEKDLS